MTAVEELFLNQVNHSVIGTAATVLPSRGLEQGLRPGELLDDRYRILGVIGSGGMGSVFLAENELIGRRVAIKCLKPEHAADPEMLERFRREARAAASAGSEHIVDTLDLGTLPGGAPFIVMEHLLGEALASRLQSGPMAPAAAVAIARQVCRAMIAAHGRAIVHRDLKPENIFLTPRAGTQDFVKVLDFGLSKIREAGLRLDALTKTGTIMGTPYYMSPEQVQGLKNVDARSDIYAIGIILYRCLSGVIPFRARTIPKLMVEVMGGAAQPLNVYRPDLSQALCAVVHRAFEREPEQRYRSAAELESALAEVAPESEVLMPGWLPPAGWQHSAPEVSGTISLKRLRTAPAPEASAAPTRPLDPVRLTHHAASTQLRLEDAPTMDVSAVGVPRKALSQKALPQKALPQYTPDSLLSHGGRVRLGWVAGAAAVGALLGALGLTLLWWLPEASDAPAVTRLAATQITGQLEPLESDLPKSAKPKVFAVEIEVVPAEALIRVGGRVITARPLHLELAASDLPVTVEAELEGYAPFTQVIAQLEGDRRLRFALAPLEEGERSERSASDPDAKATGSSSPKAGRRGESEGSMRGAGASGARAADAIEAGAVEASAIEASAAEARAVESSAVDADASAGGAAKRDASKTSSGPNSRALRPATASDPDPTSAPWERPSPFTFKETF